MQWWLSIDPGVQSIIWGWGPQGGGGWASDRGGLNPQPPSDYASARICSHPMTHSTYLTHIYTCILLTLLTFFALPILNKIQIYEVWFLFGMTPGVDSYPCHFGTINK